MYVGTSEPKSLDTSKEAKRTQHVEGTQTTDGCDPTYVTSEETYTHPSGSFPVFYRLICSRCCSYILLLALTNWLSIEKEAVWRQSVVLEARQPADGLKQIAISGKA